MLGQDHADVANTIENIGVIYAQQGKFDVSLSKFQEALDIRIMALGADHVDVSTTQYKMALVYEEKGEPKTALALCVESVQRAARALGVDHPEVAKRMAVRERLQKSV